MKKNNKGREQFTIKRLVIKIGTSTITDKNGVLDAAFMDHVADQVHALRESGVMVSIISSGSVACGKVLLKDYFGDSILSNQVLATRGQPMLMNTWSKSFSRYNIHTFQYLLTQSNLEHPKLPLRECMEIGVPIINYNDAVSTEELKQLKKDADNDDIAACVARLTGADMTIFLTQGNGVLDKEKKTIGELHVADSNEISFNGTSNGGTGGMQTKIKYASEIVKHGGNVFIVDGRTTDVLLRVASGEHIGTKILGGTL